MRILKNTITALIGLICVIGTVDAGDFRSKTVSIIRGPDGRPCTFFILDDVAVADPATPNSPWMVLRQASPGYKENLAILMSAKLTGRPVHVTTTGSVVSECGQVEAYVVMLP